MRLQSVVLLSAALAAPAAAQVPDTLRPPAGTRADTVRPNPASLAASATVPELLAGRVAGLQVRPGSGTVASGSRLQLRGASGAVGTQAPLVVVDGVRVVSDAQDLLTGTGPAPSRLDDLAPDDIESVEVLRGPAAAARYGPEAAGGVLEVRTRRGRAGRPRVHAFAEAGLRSDAGEYPANYGRVGRLAEGTRTTMCTLILQAARTCTPVGDSLLSFNPLKAAPPFREGAQRRAGASVEGGAGPLTYAAGAFAERDLGVLREDHRERNSVRGAFAATPARGVEVGGSVLHLQGEAAIPSVQTVLLAALFGAPVDDPVNRGYRTGPFFGTPAGRDSLAVDQSVRRTVAAATGRWTPLPWLRVDAIYGIDRSAVDEERQTTLRPELGGGVFTERGFHDRTRRNAGVAGRAGFTPAASLRLATTVGAERLSERRATREEAGAGSLSSYEETGFRDRHVGVYGVQEVEWRGRVAVTAALRRDEEHFTERAFRSGSLGASWDVGAESFFRRPAWMDGVRLRAAYGRIERDPDVPLEILLSTPIDPLCDYDCSPLPPERVSDAEAGVDVGLFGRRVELSLTAYERTTRDLLRAIPFSLGTNFSGFRLLSGGEVANRGAEGRLRLRSAEGSRLVWELDGVGAVNRNRAGLGDEVASSLAPYQSVRDGEPLGVFFGRRVTGFQDRNGDGIIGAAGCPGAQCEVELSAEAEALGQPDPTRMLSLGGRIGTRGLHLSALLDHQGGASLPDVAFRERCRGLANCREANDPSTPLAVQAEVVALRQGVVPVRDASFTRLREAAVTAEVPAGWARSLGTRGAALTVAGRNLALWSSFPDADPETNAPGQLSLERHVAASLPLPRVLVTRVELRF
jgi:outer membrane receptor protein involved in Fe transport